MLLDTYAWVEYFRGTNKGKKIRELLKETQCFTSAISLAELSYWAEKEKIEAEGVFSTVKKLSALLSIDITLLEMAGKIKYKKRLKMKDFGLIDAIILATSKTYGLNVVTGDKHFIEEEGTIQL